MKKIAVLMSTYNGEKYIKQQIDSIFNQNNVEVKLFIRDDGSSDNTLKIIEEESKKFNIQYYNGKNLKSAKSFMELIFLMEKENYDYYALADQDDYWEDNKLCKAISELEKDNSENGKLYISSLNIVDENLKFQYKTKIAKKITFKKEMIKNYATGCTMVFDKNLKNYLVGIETPDISMHDSYIMHMALINKAFIFVDENSYILYRQHSNNVLGMPTNYIKKWKVRWNHFVHSKCYTSNDAKNLLKIKNLKIEEKDKEFLIYLTEYKISKKIKLKLFLTHIFEFDELINDILYRIKLIFNKI